MVIGPRSAPFVRAGWTCLQLCCLPGPGESSTAFLAATIGRPCPNCPTSRSSPRPSTRPSRAVPSPPPRRPGRSPSAARRPSSTRSSGSALVDLRRRGKFLIARLRSRSDRLQPDADRPVPAGGARRRSCRRRRRSSSGSASARARRATPPAGRAARLDAGRRRRGRDPLPRSDPDGQGLPAAGRRRPARARPDRRRAGPGRRRSVPDARRLARSGSAVTPAS